MQPVKSIEIEIGGKKRNIRYDLNAWCWLEEKFGKKLDDVDLNSLPLNQVRAFLFAGLMHEDPKLTEKDVGSWLDMGNINDFAEMVAKAQEEQTPEEGASRPTVNPEESTGSTSGPSEESSLA